MKILVVSEDEEVASALSRAIANEAKDAITYRYLLKAMDNAVEISPDAVIINAVDYPRHWKVLLSYMKCMSLNPVAALYIPRTFDGDDDKEATALGVFLTFCSVDDEDALAHVVQDVIKQAGETAQGIGDAGDRRQEGGDSGSTRDRGEEAVDSGEGALGAESGALSTADGAVLDAGRLPLAAQQATIPPSPLPLIFTHPKTGAFVTGSVLSFDGENAVFCPDRCDMAASLFAGDVINELSYKKNGIMYSSKATITATLLSQGGAAGGDMDEDARVQDGAAGGDAVEGGRGKEDAADGIGKGGRLCAQSKIISLCIG